jgi:hypothetical protein
MFKTNLTTFPLVVCLILTALKTKTLQFSVHICYVLALKICENEVKRDLDYLNGMIIKSEVVLTSYNEARDSSVRARRELYLIELARSNYTCNINTQQLTLSTHNPFHKTNNPLKKNIQENLN